MDASPSKLKDRIRHLEERMDKLSREYMNLKAREKRAKTSCKTLMEKLSKENLVSEGLKQKLDQFKGKIYNL